MYLVEYKKDISELEQVWWGAEALSLWGEAEGAEHVQPGERLLCGDHNAVLNYLMERNREKVDGVLEEEWEVMDMSWKMANIAEKISPWCDQTVESVSSELEGSPPFEIFKIPLEKSMSSLL